MGNNQGSIDNATWARQLKNGEVEAYRRLYDTYYDKLIHLAKRYPLKHLTPEDFVQETIVRIHKNKDKIKEDIPIETHVIVNCKNIIFNQLKRERIMFSLDDEYDEVASDESEEKNVEFVSEEYKKLMKVMDALPEKQREIFTLHKVEKFSYEEIEEMTGLSKKTIANHIYLAKKNILKAFPHLSVYVLLFVVLL